MSTRVRVRTTRTLPAAAARPVVGAAALPARREGGPRPRRASPELSVAPRRTVLGIRLPRLGPARRPRWPRLVLAVVAVYATALTAADVAHLLALDRQIAAVDAQIARVNAHDAALQMEAAALQSPADIADTARQWLGMAAPGDVVFTPVAPTH
jgi:cell division protein FtsB